VKRVDRVRIKAAIRGLDNDALKKLERARDKYIASLNEDIGADENDDD